MTDSPMEMILNIMIESMREVGITDEQFKQIDRLVSDKMKAISDERFDS